MKNYQKIVALSLITLSLTFTYGCELKLKTEKEPLMAQAIEPIEETKGNTVKIALLLDTSNSMDGLINQAKSQLWDIVNELSYAKCHNSKPNLQIALYEYGNDGLEQSDGFIRQVLNFSDDLDEISKKLFAIILS